MSSAHQHCFGKAALPNGFGVAVHGQSQAAARASNVRRLTN
ncbi:hypothetical protein ACQ4M4_21960 [Leptolyngbya sp. AN02str]